MLMDVATAGTPSDILLAHGRLDPRKLETFRVVAQTRKISSAAKLLHLSQPAVTAQIRALEEECGRSLLLRSSKGVTPNDWGLRLLDAAKQVHELLGEVETAFQGEPDRARRWSCREHDHRGLRHPAPGRGLPRPPRPGALPRCRSATLPGCWSGSPTAGCRSRSSRGAALAPRPPRALPRGRARGRRGQPARDLWGSLAPSISRRSRCC